MANETEPEFLRNLSWREWQLPTIIVTTLLVLLLFLPQLDGIFTEAWIRYALFILAIIIDISACLSIVLPMTFYDDRLLDMDGTTGRRTKKEDLNDPRVQLRLYRELRQAFISRIKRRRKLSTEAWNGIMRDADALCALVPDDELLAFLSITLSDQVILTKGHGVVVFGDGFHDKFESLLGKMEGWS